MDPDLQSFYQAIEAAESGPPNREEGVGVDARDLEEILTWMKNRFDSDRYDEVWSRRVELGYSLARNDAPAETWFWVNALPALAALRQGERHHPFVATAAAYAEDAERDLHEPSDLVRSAMAEIKERFFGGGANR